MGAWDQRFREAQDYASAHGFAAAFPNFHEADYGDGVVYGTYLLRSSAVTWRDVPRSQLGGPAIDDLPAMFRAAATYAAANGFVGAFPTFHQGDHGNGVVYGINLIGSTAAEFRDVPRAELGVFDLNDAPRMLRAADDYASANGFAAAFPTFHQANHGQGVVYGLVLFASGAVTWRDVPAELLRAYSDRSTPMLVVLCHPSDMPPPAGSRQRWLDMFEPGGTDPSNVVRYFQDVSFGQYDANGTLVTAWLDLQQTDAQLRAGGEQRSKVINAGLQAAQAAGIATGAFDHLVVACNVNYDHGSGGGNRVLLAYAEGRPFEPTFFFHEVGHAMGLGHSSADNIDGMQPPLGTTWGERVYENRFDIMSAMRVFGFADAANRTAGPGACAITLENRGWLHRSRVRNSFGYQPESVTLAALNRPDVDQPLALRLFDPLTLLPAFHVEYREPTAWDAGFGEATVLVTHRNQESGAEVAGSGRNYTGALVAGEEIVVRTGIWSSVIRVESIDRASSTAVVRVWLLPLAGGRSVRVASIVYDPPGVEWAGERVVLRNDTAAAVTIGGWVLSDRAGHDYDVPAGFVLEPGHEVRVWTGEGVDSATDLHMGRRAAIWNNQGDTATLRNAAGQVVATYAYGNGG